ncbi:MAG: AAA family ATPase [Candidatus Cloacimonetes bacterium]|nr:AAA family ATPase [Candidatus Cloacimonadota bacterium]
MKCFNITGTCIPAKYYIVDTENKLNKILRLIEHGNYFVINRPRQYGKTTTKSLLSRKLRNMEGYLPIQISFEAISDSKYSSEELFVQEIVNLLLFKLNQLLENDVKIQKLAKIADQVVCFDNFSGFITELVNLVGKKVVLFIDEIDKSCNHRLFLQFLALLRNKYLDALENEDTTFHSIVLIGVHDIKTLKMKYRNEEEKKYNSPWNIAVDFNIDMSFNPAEIATMLTDYSNETGHQMDIKAVSEKIHFWTNGYPFLVSKLCKIVDEDFLPERESKNWSTDDIDNAVKELLQQSNTLFDDMIKNIENNPEYYDFIEKIVIGSKYFNFVVSDNMINLGVTYGILKNQNGITAIHNKIFEEYLTNHFTAKIARSATRGNIQSTQEPYIKHDGRLDFPKVLLKFQEVIKEKYSSSDLLKSDEFLENDLRLLFLIFLKPIINGLGFSFKEVQTSEEKRLDVIVVFRDEKFVVELKIWRGMEYHKKGIQQIKDYMRRESVNSGYMLIMDKNRNKAFSHEIEDEIIMVWV